MAKKTFTAEKVNKKMKQNFFRDSSLAQSLPY